MNFLEEFLVGHELQFLSHKVPADLIHSWCLTCSQMTKYCVRTSKRNVDGVIQNSLFKTMIGWKGLPGFFYIKWKEGEKELDSGETERESVCERQSIAERER
jgi:hypothetical protein